MQLYFKNNATTLVYIPTIAVYLPTLWYGQIVKSLIHNTIL